MGGSFNRPPVPLRFGRDPEVNELAVVCEPEHGAEFYGNDPKVD
jgi:hypothetical protein